MDLTRLYNLTTPELRQEAERLGVSDTYAMSRGQLIHAIRNRAGGEASEGFFGKVLGFAKWALQAAQEEPPKRRGSEPREPQRAEPEPPKMFHRPSDTPMPTIGTEPEPASASAPEPAPAPVSTPASALGAVSSSTPAEASESGPPSRPPAGVFSKTASMFDEPFPTRTMARILADQGHFKRALAIYATLLRDEPGNVDLVAEVEEVRARSRARRPHIH